MNIIFFESNKREISAVKNAFSGHKVEFISEALNEKNLSKAKDADVISIFIYSKINSAMLDKMKRLKLIATRSTGYDHIELEACRKRNILVSNVPRYGENTVAEHAFALLLAISRKIIDAKEQVKIRKIDLESLPCFDLKDKTLGVIGAGRIGLSMIRMAKGFNMNVLAYDIFQNAESAKEAGFRYVSLEHLLKSSDVISIHALLTEQTRHLLDKRAFEKMKPGVVIINTARGPIIELSALIKALKENKVAAAGLDVFEHETLLIKENKEDMPIHYLINSKKVIITPHMAFYSRESLERIIEITLENINSYLLNKPVNLVKNE